MEFLTLLFGDLGGWELFADIDRLSEAGRYLKRPMSPGVQRTLIISVIGIAAFWGGLFLWDRLRKRITERPDPLDELSRELADAHSLGNTEVGLILRISRKLKLSENAAIFVNPDIVEDYMVQFPDDALAARRLERKLFGDVIDVAELPPDLVPDGDSEPVAMAET